MKFTLFLLLFYSLSAHQVKRSSSSSSLISRYAATVLSLALLCPLPSPAALESSSSSSSNSLQEQLKAVRVLQVEQQRERVIFDKEEENINERSYEAGKLLARGVVALPPAATSNPADFPFGYTEAAALDAVFGNEKAALILTAISKQGPPIAARRYENLRDLKFPLVFEMTTDDLLFPYNAEIWRKSPRSRSSISVTAVLEPDGRLVTAEPESRFGFAISDPMKEDPLEKKEGDKEEEEVMLRTDAKISVSMRSDGRAYSKEEMEMLQRVDDELDRLAKK